ncbi:FixH family protein [Neobacillus niacini]|uniref:FixH family protein n=1 Tax=Neobacillus niacini TaxID=86668 RepID=UPI0021CB148A|nr:FixH family protein [Neobacillus niacini]MCM3767894.1 FixH family protein [Neobacillus niacini]
MKKYLAGMISLLLLLLAASCSNDNNEQNTPLPELLEVKLTVNPEKAEPNQAIVFEAKVTQGKEEVTDADKVTFEIWRAHDEKHEKIDVKHSENGIYRLEKNFDREGTYYIISHVSARDMHNMPKKEFVVGTPSEPEDAKSTQPMEGMDMKDDHEADNGH